MRLWSINPCYLDKIGLVAVWREGLLAQKVLLGRTKGYKKHPQLKRFLLSSNPLSAMSVYLYGIFKEAQRRGYSFSKEKITCKKITHRQNILVKKGQLAYEFSHLLKKLKKRDAALYLVNSMVSRIKPHPLFKIVPGGIESWESVKD